MTGERVKEVAFGLGVMLDLGVVGEGDADRRPQSVKNFPFFPPPLSFPFSSMIVIGGWCKGKGMGLFLFAANRDTLRAIDVSPLALEGDGMVWSEVEMAAGGRGKNIVFEALGRVVEVALGRGASSKGLQFWP